MSRYSLQRLAASPAVGVASRTLAAVFGGYALAACATTAPALWPPAAPAPAVTTANLLSLSPMHTLRCPRKGEVRHL